MKKDSEGFLTVKGKELKSPLILKKNIHSNNEIPEVVVDLIDLMCLGKSLTCLCLMIDIPQERNYAERHRLILRKSFLSIKLVDLQAVIIPYKTDIESNLRKWFSQGICIDQQGKIPRSITQLQKHFLKGKPKRGGRTALTNLLLLHEEDIEDMMLDVKDSMQECNPKLGKKRFQHYKVVKLGCV